MPNFASDENGHWLCFVDESMKVTQDVDAGGNVLKLRKGSVQNDGGYRSVLRGYTHVLLYWGQGSPQRMVGVVPAVKVTHCNSSV